MIFLHRYSCRLIIATFLISIAVSRNLSAEEHKLTPQKLIGEHLKSIGSPEVLARIRTRDVMGFSTVQILQGPFGIPIGEARIASDGHRLAVSMQYKNLAYPGEHFGFDGKDVTVGRYIPPGTLSPLGDFLNRFNGLMKEGLLGGILSTGWALQAVEEKQPRMKYEKESLKGRSMHALVYRPKKGLGDIKIVLFFEPETYRHVRSEYKLSITPGLGTVMTYILLSEDFADFREVDGLMLPHRYTITYSSEGQVKRTFLAHWFFDASKWIHNGPIDPDIFRSPK